VGNRRLPAWAVARPPDRDKVCLNTMEWTYLLQLFSFINTRTCMSFRCSELLEQFWRWLWMFLLRLLIVTISWIIK
jgi:hypothetical protein